MHAWSLLAALQLATGTVQAEPTTPTMADVQQSTASAATSRGLPFDEYEAEDAQTGGTIIGPDRRFGTLAAEASGRRAVRLNGAGESVEILLRAPASALTVRYAIPDSADGSGLDSQLLVHANGVSVASTLITSRYSWFYGKYPFSNNPRDGGAHHFWSEVRIVLPRLLPAGTRLAVSTALNSPASWTAIDVIDAEVIPAIVPQPADALSVVAFGADPSGKRNSQTSVFAAVKVARETRRPLYFPVGRYRIDGHVVLDRVKVVGAGPWFTVLFGKGVGLCSRPHALPSTDVHVRDISIEGMVDERRDDQPLSAICGRFSRSSFSNMFLHRTKVGVWIDGPGENLLLQRLRITDQTADGINLHRGIRSAVIKGNFIRNSGDDGIALWSEKDANSDIIIRDNHVVAPILANGIAIYGGRNIVIAGNVVADTVTQGGGIHLGTRFKSASFSGSIDIRHNQLVRTGSFDPNWRFGVGAIWFYALEQPIAGARITISNLRIEDSSCEAVQFIGSHPTSSISLDGIDIRNSGDMLLAFQSPGSITVRALHDIGKRTTTKVLVPPNFKVSGLGGNEGWQIVQSNKAVVPLCFARRWTPVPHLGF